MDEKAAWALAGAGLGWALTFGSTHLKERVRIWRLASAMREELADVLVQVNGVIETHSRNLQIAGAEGLGPSGFLPVHHLLFEQAYKEVFPYLSQARRLSFQLIHAAVDSLNEQNRGIDAFFVRETQDIEPDQKALPKVGRRWADNVQAAFINAHDIVWYIDAHLRHPTGKVVDVYSHDHRAWLQNRVSVEAQAAALMAEGKRLGLDGFAATFDARSFDAQARKSGKGITASI